MSVAKVIELIAESEDSFEDAIRQGVQRAARTLDNVTGAWIKDQSIEIDGEDVVRFRVVMKVTFVLSDGRARADEERETGSSRSSSRSSGSPASKGSKSSKKGSRAGR